MNKSPLVDVDDERGRVLSFKSATYVGDFYSEDARKGDDVIVNASCSGVYGASLVSRHAPKAAILVDCGIGKDGAGIARLLSIGGLCELANRASSRRRFVCMSGRCPPPTRALVVPILCILGTAGLVVIGQG